MADKSGNTQLAVSDASAALSATSDMNMDHSVDHGGATAAKSHSLGSNMDLLRQFMLIGVVVVGLSLILIFYFWSQAPEMRPLGTYQTSELIPTLDYLDQQKIEYKLEGSTVLVPVKEYSTIKLGLARAGLNTAQEEGDDILMQDMGFGVSQQLETERLKLSRERQLASAIEKIRAVSNARVLLAMPKQSVFVRHNQNASATVFLTVRGSNQLGQEEIDSIVDMVASAVPGLEPSRVTVTDQYGRLLSSGNQDPIASQRRKEYELERNQEQALREKIDSILIPVLGLGNYTAQVNVNLDFSALEETKKIFEPATPPAIRSEYTREDYNNAGAIGGIPGALSNQPPADAAIPQDIQDLKNGGPGADNSLSKEATRNFELDSTISYRRAQTGFIVRQTVSVAINYIEQTNPETGETTLTAISNDELEKIKRLLEGSIGFSKERGDVIEVIAVSFVQPKQEPIPEIPFWQQPYFNDWVRWIGTALVTVFVGLVLIRPALAKLLHTPPEENLSLGPNGEMLGADGLPLTPDEDIGLLGGDLDGSMEIGSSISLPNLHKDEDLLKAVRALVANEPDLAAQVVKNWVNENA